MTAGGPVDPRLAAPLAQLRQALAALGWEVGQAALEDGSLYLTAVTADGAVRFDADLRVPDGRQPRRRRRWEIAPFEYPVLPMSPAVLADHMAWYDQVQADHTDPHSYRFVLKGPGLALCFNVRAASPAAAVAQLQAAFAHGASFDVPDLGPLCYAELFLYGDEMTAAQILKMRWKAGIEAVPGPYTDEEGDEFEG